MRFDSEPKHVPPILEKAALALAHAFEDPEFTPESVVLAMDLPALGNWDVRVRDRQTAVDLIHEMAQKLQLSPDGHLERLRAIWDLGMVAIVIFTADATSLRVAVEPADLRPFAKA